MNKEYDLFISYADADRPWVEGYLLDTLTQAGVRHLSETAFRLGAPRIQEFQCAVQQSQRTLLVVRQSNFTGSNWRIQALKLNPCARSFKAPINTCFLLITLFFPSENFIGQCLYIWNPTL